MSALVDTDLPSGAETLRRFDERDSGWPLCEVVAWLMAEGRLISNPAQLLDSLAAKLLDVGAPIWRIRVGIRTIHPLVAAWAYVWRREGGMTETRILHGIEQSDAYVGSPMQTVFESRRTLHTSLADLDPDSDHPVLHEIAAEGGVDYLGIPIVFSSGAVNAMIMVTDRPSGFSRHDVERFQVVAHCLAPLLEVIAMHRVAHSLLDTYVGPRTGQRILSGQIRRGDGEQIEAVIWFSDLRDFTPLTEHLPAKDMLAMLNSYFELVEAAVSARGGEILRFIGDAMLIIFPVNAADGAAGAARAAIDAAGDAVDSMAVTNHRRRRQSLPEIRFGVGLHVGTVIYGNVGAPARLDFTVMGPAVNRAARIEDLTKVVGSPVLLSADVAALLPQLPMHSAGFHLLKGVDDAQEVFVPESFVAHASAAGGHSAPPANTERHSSTPKD